MANYCTIMCSVKINFKTKTFVTMRRMVNLETSERNSVLHLADLLKMIYNMNDILISAINMK